MAVNKISFSEFTVADIGSSVEWNIQVLLPSS